MKPKARPGVCGLCGVAVVQPEEVKLGWHRGHLYERKLLPNQTKFSEPFLVRVRCMRHKEPGDPRRYDSKTGEIVEVRDLEDGFCCVTDR